MGDRHRKRFETKRWMLNPCLACCPIVFSLLVNVRSNLGVGLVDQNAQQYAYKSIQPLIDGVMVFDPLILSDFFGST
jgi:hypothetical protein